MNLNIDNLPKVKSGDLKASSPIAIACVQYTKTTNIQGKKEPLSSEQTARTTITHKHTQKLRR